MEDEGRENEIRNNPLVFETINKEGKAVQQTYKFTGVGLLPNNPLYGIKWLRDWLWLCLSHGKARAKVALLLGDKRMIESKELFDVKAEKLAIKTANEAVDKLEYADYLNNDKNGQLQKQILLAGFAYREILSKRDKIEDVNSQNWANLIKRIDDWNKKMVEKT